ncbi:MAG: TonB-dependent receptor [Rhizomicrobium sp.]
MTKGRPALWQLLLTTTMLTGVAVPALAADADTGGGIETVVVTAEKRSEDLQKVPLSIQALPTEKLQQLQITDFAQYARYLPSVTYTVGGAGAGNGGPGFANVSMRGVSSGGDGNHSGSLPTVGVYLDEQPITTIGGSLDVHVYDIARVESLSGPQGTLYGASSEAGTLRIITNKPDFTGTYGGFDAGVDTVDHGGIGYEAEGFVNLPLTDKIAIRLVAYDEHDAGYIDNIPGSRTFPTSGITVTNAAVVRNDFNVSDTAGGRLEAEIDLDNNWTLSPSLIVQRTNSSGLFGYDASLGDLKVQQFFPDFAHDSWYQAALTVQGKISNLDVVYSGGYMERNINAASDYTDYSFFYDTLHGYGAYTVDNHNNLIDPQQYILEKDHFTKLSQEVRVSSPQEGPFRWLGGLFFERQTHHILQNYTVAGLSDENADPGVPQMSVPGWPGTLWLTNQQREDIDVAAFGQVSYDVTPDITLTAGGRVFYAANSLQGFFGFSSDYSSHTGVAGCLGRPPIVPNTPCTDLNASVYESGFTHKLNATWRIDDDRMVYATWSTGFRPGGVNRRATVPNYQPDRLTNYEIGAKTGWFDNTLHVNVAAYIEDWNRFQFSFLGQNAFTEIHNAGNARIYGAEGDFVWQPVEGLSLSGAGTYTDAHLTTDYCGPVVGGVIINQCPGPVDPWQPDAPKGTQLPGTPKFKANMIARYEFPFQGLLAHVQGGLVYQSTSWADLRLNAADPTSGDPLSMPVPVRSVLGPLKAFTTADFSFGAETDHWGVDLTIANAFDEREQLYRSAQCTVQTCEGTLYTATDQPRTFGIRVTHKID